MVKLFKNKINLKLEEFLLKDKEIAEQIIMKYLEGENCEGILVR